MAIKQLAKFMLWEIINPLLLRKRKRRPFPADLHGINLGCGVDNPPQWQGLDGGVYLVLRRLPRFVAKRLFKLFASARHYEADTFLNKLYGSPILHCDLAKGLPYTDHTVPAVFSSHFFEHIRRDEALSLLRECRRVLKPNGIIRICVPDLQHEAAVMQQALADYTAGYPEPIMAYLVRQDHGFINRYEHHRAMYDWPLLEALLTEVGFVDITQRERQVGDIADVHALDSRGGLFVEARQPANLPAKLEDAP